MVLIRTFCPRKLRATTAGRALNLFPTAQHRWRGIARGSGILQPDNHLRTRFATSPSAEDFKQVVAFREIRDLGRNRVPRNVPDTAYRCETWTDLVPVGTNGRFFRRADARQSGRIEQDDTFVSDFQFDRSMGRDWL